MAREMETGNSDDAKRRAYWTGQMEKAHEFVLKMYEYPVDECGEGMVPLRDAAGVEVTFSEKPHVKGLERIFVIREGLIGDFAAIAREMNDRGWVLKVEDAYRTTEMQKFLLQEEYVFDVALERVMWECAGAVPSPEFMFRRIGALIALAPKVGTHMSGSALDISVLRRDDGSEVDRGGPYVEMSERTPMDSPFISSEARKNRRAITAVMRRHGFVPYPWEFWHYSKGDAYDEYFSKTGKHARYGPVHMNADGSVIPIQNPREPLNSYEEIQREINRALARAKGADSGASG